MHVHGKLVGHTDLIARVKNIYFKHKVYFFKFLIDKRYVHKKRIHLKKRYMVEDGLAESVRCDPYDRHVLNMLLVLF